MSMAFTRRVTTSVAPPPTLELVTWRVLQTLHLGGRRLVAQGEKTYEPHRDVLVHPVKGSKVDARTVSLPLNHGFALSVSVAKTPLDGFGLFLSRPSDSNGFSWNWFDRQRGQLFAKRQGQGRVQADVQIGFGYEELASIEFLDEVVLRYLDDIRKPPGTFSHEIVIGKGSVFKFGY